MKIILGSRRHHYMARVGIFLITVALIAGMLGCGSSGVGGNGGDGGESYTLTIDGTAGDIVNVDNVTIPGKAIFTYDPGTVVSLNATPDSGYQFLNWTGDVATIANVNAAVTNITMDGSYNITAKFEQVKFMVTVGYLHTLGLNWDGSVVALGCNCSPPSQPSTSPKRLCFIATSAYGTPMADEIRILREFRDKYLLTNPPGRAFVDFYYRVSPPIAEFITEHPSLKPIVRAGLLPVVAMSTIVVNTTPTEKMAIVGLLALVSVAVAVWGTRRRGRGAEHP